MEILFDYVAKLVANNSQLNFDEIHTNLEIPNANIGGDVALPCFKFAKALRLAPVAIAEQIASSIKDENLEKVENVNGFLNFTFKPDFLAYTLLDNALLEQNEISEHNGMKNKTILIEHTSINPNASPHIGRARNALIADSLVRVFKFLGWKTDIHYFVNDVGKQIAMLVYATKDKKDINFNDLLQIYIDVNEQAKINPEIENAVFEYLNKFESGDEQVIAEFERIVNTCIKGQTAIFDELGIKWDSFDYESRYIHQHLTEKVLDELKKSPKLFEDKDGRYVLDQHGENIGIEEPMLVLTRNDKTSLYPLRDICYSMDKAKAGTDRNLLVLGEDQKVYFQQISAAMRLLGAEPAEVVHYSFVLLPDGKMSTRRGTVVLLEDFMREATAKADEAISERRGDSDIEKAKKVGYGALKYSILKCSPEKNVLFDWANALNFNGDSSVFAQYNYARIQSILQKADMDYNNAKHSLLTRETEIALIKEVSRFESVVLSVYRNLNPSILANYIFNLTSKFSQFYAAESILNIEDAELKKARLSLISKVATALKNGLYLLGIDIVESL
ncbi:MAG: arginine--tRNA ligase [Clostridia bacterium]|nr:arginine--tRNA ligase [Clostridia bacterium]